MAEYIEREALWRAFEYEPFYDNADRDEIVLPKIDAFPAADVAPVRHGRWVDAYGVDTVGMVNGVPWSDCTCSICGEYLTGSGEYPAKGNYCPNCGARMDGE